MLGPLATNRRRTVGGGGGITDIADAALGTLVAWYCPRDATKVALSGSNVTGITDSTGNGNDLTKWGSNDIDYTRTLNGEPVLDMVALTGLRAGGLTTPAVNTGTWFAVYDRDAAEESGANGAYARVLALCNGTNASGTDHNSTGTIAAILRIGGSNNFGSWYNNSQRAVMSVGAPPSSFIIVTRRDGDTSDVWVNGVKGTTVTGLGTTNFGVDRIEIGSNGNTGAEPLEQLNGGLGDTGWYEEALSDAAIEDDLTVLLDSIFAVV